MAEDTAEIKTSQAAKPQKPKASGYMARLARQAERELENNRRILDEAAPSGLASHSTLESRGFVAGPQGGEKLPRRLAPTRYTPKRR